MSELEELEEEEEETKGYAQITPNDPEWSQWLKICDYTGWEPYGLLKPMKYGKRVVPYNKEMGITPLFLNTLRARLSQVKPIRIALVGEAGISKTYSAIEIAQMIDEKFGIDQILFKGEQYVSLQRIIKPRRAIVLEEPTFHLAARSWYKDWQKIIVQTIESTRFQNNPLLIPVVNRNLLDKIVREYYVTYVIFVLDRGIARVYKTYHSQWDSILIKYTSFDIYLYTPGIDLAECGRKTCLECEELPTCNKFIWPQYERKRAEAISYYQAEGEEKLKKIEKKEQDRIVDKKILNREIVEKAWELREKLKDVNGKYSVLKIILEFGVNSYFAQLIVKELRERTTFQTLKNG